MPNTRKGDKIELYNSHFAATLRDLMEKHGTTQKELAKSVGVRPQTISLYMSGDTQPTVDNILKIAKYFNVTTDYLITGTIIEDVPVREMLGLSERTVENMKLVKDGYFEDTPLMLSVLDRLLGDKDFYTALEKAVQYYGMARQLTDDDNGTKDEQAEFYEWKAEQYMQNYLLDFFSSGNYKKPQTKQPKKGD